MVCVSAFIGLWLLAAAWIQPKHPHKEAEAFHFAEKIVTLYSASGEKLLEINAKNVWMEKGLLGITCMDGKVWYASGTIVIRPADAPMP